MTEYSPARNVCISKRDTQNNFPDIIICHILTDDNNFATKINRNRLKHCIGEIIEGPIYTSSFAIYYFSRLMI